MVKFSLELFYIRSYTLAMSKSMYLFQQVITVLFKQSNFEKKSLPSTMMVNS